MTRIRPTTCWLSSILAACIAMASVPSEAGDLTRSSTARRLPRTGAAVTPADAKQDAPTQKLLVRRATRTAPQTAHRVLDPEDLADNQPLVSETVSGAEAAKWEVVELAPGTDADKVRDELKASGLYEAVESNQQVTLESIPNDTYFSFQWSLHDTEDRDIDAPEAWDYRSDASQIVVAVIDTGMDLNHPDLAPNLWTNQGEVPGNGRDDDGNGVIDDVHGADFTDVQGGVLPDGNPSDDSGHGTHVAGIIGAAGYDGLGVSGVAQRVKLMPIRFARSTIGPAGAVGDLVALYRAIYYAIQEDADVIVASWGFHDPSAQIQEAINAAERAGILVVAAAGNYGMNLDNWSFYPASYTNANIVAVAAVDRLGTNSAFPIQNSDNSTRYYRTDFGQTSVDLAAPGVGIFSTLPGGAYGYRSGTSVAAAHVAGAAALVKARFDNLSMADWRSALVDTGTVMPVGVLTPTVASGRSLNLARAVLGPDRDKDGVPDSNINNPSDNCVGTFNPYQEDMDRDRIGNHCDPDIDGDGVSNGPDNCDFTVNSNQSDLDRDGVGDVCDVTIRGFAPVAVADSICMLRNTSRELRIRRNDSDQDHDQSLLTVVAPYGVRPNGTLSQNPTNAAMPIFTPNRGFVGTARFDYYLLDPLSNRSNDARVTIQVQTSCP